MESAKQTTRLPAVSSLVLLLLSTFPLVSGSPTLTEDSSCGCFVTNGTESSYFTKHKFFDFRSLTQYAGVPATITNPNESGTAAVTSQYFTSTEWTETWMVGNWNNSAGVRKDSRVLMVNSPNNVYIEANGDRNPSSQTFLTLRTQRLPEFQTAAEIESVSGGFRYLSVRMLARTIGAPGAITALFTYRHSDKIANVQEADLEIRTRDPRNTLQYTNQPSYTEDGDDIEEATQNATMPEGRDWTAWAVHRLDWSPTTTEWYIDGIKVANNSFQTPRDASKVILNAWSDGGEWSGNMTNFDAAYLQIQWLDITYNTTDEKTAKFKRDEGDLLSGRDDVGPQGALLARATDQGTCKVVCSIDETTNLGQPVMLWNNGAVRVAGKLDGVVSWIPSAAIFALFVLSLR
ncbi:Concanavalin A-like lectin/glucanase domain containing protein [Naviculisporaceae sp. PSN 640]